MLNIYIKTVLFRQALLYLMHLISALASNY